jgi:hypothetical protein
VALLKTIPAFASKTFVTMVPEGTKPTLPYLIVHPADGSDSQERVTGPRVTHHPRFTLHTVGGSYAQVAAGAKQVKDKLVVSGRGVTLAITGEVCQPCWYESPIPIQIDTDVTPALVYHVAEVGFRADPRP